MEQSCVQTGLAHLLQWNHTGHNDRNTVLVHSPRALLTRSVWEAMRFVNFSVVCFCLHRVILFWKSSCTSMLFLCLTSSQLKLLGFKTLTRAALSSSGGHSAHGTCHIHAGGIWPLSQLSSLSSWGGHTACSGVYSNWSGWVVRRCSALNPCACFSNMD